MRRRELIALLALAVATRHVNAQKSPSRVGILWHAANEEEEAIYLGAVRRGLGDFGYIEGTNIILENRLPAEIPERFISLAAELAAIKVDVLIAINRLAALAAQRATTAIPIVFVAIPDPIGAKLVTSLARPDGNMTGLTNFATDLTGKRLEFLKEVVPSVSHVALLVNPNDKEACQVYIEEAQRAAQKLDVTLHPNEVRAPADLEPAFSKMRDNKIDGIVVSQDGLFYANRKSIADLALSRRLPAAVYSRETVDAGALLSYGPDNYAIFRRSGYYIDKILKGAKPSDLPVEQPTKFEFIVNLKTAKALGLEVLPTLVARADKVIE
jgi:putative ABC transport system substrate-binding protein